ncbi:hypothetical protein FUAX_27950 [Fulvitalea axinellae]|uniref:Carboxypeptidase-like regulatory domain-containing protein n=1 Tax=Fulvitalea axinellae TaxID=1182444 RepID=A0AAU9CJP6_9BACT|nr:hypothetical protein FUAX_27950 [Fulvitalea axinellae]
MNRKALFIALACLSFCFGLSAQSLKGIVLDANTQEPVPFANVFIDNTTVGTGTTPDGRFQFETGPGPFTLVVSSVGYKTQAFSIETPEKIELRIKLHPDTRMLNTVVVEEDLSQWEKHYAIFKNYFIGSPGTPFVDQCEILNPKVLHFDMNHRTRVFEAWADSSLHIRNKALRYDIYIHLVDFKVFFAKQRNQMRYFTRFMDQTDGKPKGARRRADKKRRFAYFGSRLHFYRSLYHDQLNASNFAVRRILEFPNPHRPQQSLINKNLKKFRAQIRSNTSNGKKIMISTPIMDSLRYWKRMNRLPKFHTTIVRDLLPADSLIDENKEIFFNGKILVLHNPGKESMRESDVMKITTEKLPVLSNGQVAKGHLLVCNRDWAEMKIAVLLPMDYKPLSKKRKK